jgi:hypothetical protein
MVGISFTGSVFRFSAWELSRYSSLHWDICRRFRHRRHQNWS